MDNLKPETQKFLSELDEEQIDRIKRVMAVYSTAETLGKVAKWISITFLTILISITQLGDSLHKLKEWFR